MEKKFKQGTLCVQAGYKAKNGEPTLSTQINFISTNF